MGSSRSATLDAAGARCCGLLCCESGGWGRGGRTLAGWLWMRVRACIHARMRLELAWLCLIGDCLHACLLHCTTTDPLPVCLPSACCDAVSCAQDG
jgi:hypothetical protein